MSSSVVHKPASPPIATAARFSDEHLMVALADGRELTVPLAWFDWLAGAAPTDRADVEIVEGGRGLWWPSLDEGLSVAGLMGIAESD